MDSEKTVTWIGTGIGMVAAWVFICAALVLSVQFLLNHLFAASLLLAMFETPKVSAWQAAMVVALVWIMRQDGTGS